MPHMAASAMHFAASLSAALVRSPLGTPFTLADPRLQESFWHRLSPMLCGKHPDENALQGLRGSIWAGELQGAEIERLGGRRAKKKGCRTAALKVAHARRRMVQP